MRRAAGLLLLIAATAAAQTPADAPAHPGRMQRFLSPMGQPFRAPDGEPYPVAAWFAGADTDRDGKLTRAEFRADALAFFKILDANGDGIIDASEIDRYELEIAPEVRSGGGFGGGASGFEGGRGRHGGHRGGGHGGGFDDGQAPIGGEASEAKPQVEHYGETPMGGGRFGLLNIPEPVAATDVTLSRRITAKQFAEAADRRFALLDPDDTGELTLARLPRTPAEGRRRR